GLCASASLPGAVHAATFGPGWEISSVAQPSNFAKADNAICENTSGSSTPICDRYIITLTNVGSSTANEDGSLTITDSLPKGLTPIQVRGENLELAPGFAAHEFGWNCSVGTTTCTYGGPVAPGASLAMVVSLKVASGIVPVLN